MPTELPTILFLAGKEPDYQSAMLYRGFVDLLGPERAIDIGDSYYLHDYIDTAAIWGRNLTCEEIGRCAGCCGAVTSGTRNPEHVVFVLNNSHLRDTGGSFDVFDQTLSLIPDSSKVVYVIGDDHTGPYPVPSCRPSVVFQREMDDPWFGPTNTEPLLFSCLESWIITEPQNRPIDIFYAGSPTDQNRAALPRMMAELSEAGLSTVCGSGKGISRSSYMDMLRHSKMAVCPTGGGGCSDTMRNWEAIASGALPIFPSHPKRCRGYIDDDNVLDFNGITWDNFTIRVRRIRDELFGSNALDTEQKLVAMAHKNTTTARANQVLKNVGYNLEACCCRD